MKKGFTLAEVLITLAVIGVVASLTLPNVMGNYNKKTQVAQLQRVYNAITNAASQLMVQEQVDSLAESSLATDAGRDEFLYKYFKVQKDCGYSASGCLADSYQTYGKTSDFNPAATYSFSQDGYKVRCVTIESGAALCIQKMGDSVASVFLDVNGTAGPNLTGRDYFQFGIYKDARVGTYDKSNAWQVQTYSSDTENSPFTKCVPDSYQAALGCFDKIVRDGWKMDY